MNKALVFVILLCISSTAYAKYNSNEHGSVVKKVHEDGTTTIRVYLNYEDGAEKTKQVNGAIGKLNIELPIPNKWELLDVSGYLSYDTSITMLKNNSSGLILLNTVVVKQFMLLDNMGAGVTFNIDPLLFEEYNKFTFTALQHYTLKCEDSTSNQLWTKINLNKSYIDFHVKIAKFPEKLSSINAYIFDQKQYLVKPLNYIILDKSMESLKNYALFTAISSNHLKYRTVKIGVSQAIDYSTYNIIIGTKEEINYFFVRYGLENQLKKITKNINIIKNKNNSATIVISAKNEKNIAKVLYAMLGKDFELCEKSSMDIYQTKIPLKAKPYSTKGFIPLGKKIYFKELNYKTRLLKGQYPEPVKLNFKVYPDNHFDKNKNIELNLHYVFPEAVRHDSVSNIFLNGIFAKQIDIKGISKEKTINIGLGELFDWDSMMSMPAYLIENGFNTLKLELSLIPLKEGDCEIFNTENLVASILDDSYFILPKTQKWIEMPYMELIQNSLYPYSIYPDLQDTTLLLANLDNDTVAASMNFLFFLTQKIESFPFYINIAKKLDDVVKETHIVIFGTMEDSLIEELSKNTPIEINKHSIGAQYPFIKRFIEHESILEKSRTVKYKYRIETNQTKSLGSNLIVQMIRSPFNKEKTILMSVAENSKKLNKGISTLFEENNREKMRGDLLIFNPESLNYKTFNIKDKYLLSDMNMLDNLRLNAGQNPLWYLLYALIGLLLITYFLKKFLSFFKKEKHPHVD